MGKAAYQAATPTLPTTDVSANLGSGGTDPYVALNNCQIVSATFTWCSCAVHQATVGASPVIRFDVYRHTYSARVLLGTITVPVDPAKCQISDTLGNDNFQTANVTGLSIAISSGQAWGLQFTPVQTDNEKINALGRCFAVLRTTDT
jgi:hypothetical protein